MGELFILWAVCVGVTTGDFNVSYKISDVGNTILHELAIQSSNLSSLAAVVDIV